MFLSIMRLSSNTVPQNTIYRHVVKTELSWNMQYVRYYPLPLKVYICSLSYTIYTDTLIAVTSHQSPAHLCVYMCVWKIWILLPPLADTHTGTVIHFMHIILKRNYSLLKLVFHVCIWICKWICIYVSIHIRGFTILIVNWKNLSKWVSDFD